MAAKNIVEQAWKRSNIDLLTHVGVRQGRWEAMLWLACAMVETSKAPSQPWDVPDVLSTIEWPSELSLHRISRLHIGLDKIRSGEAEALRPHVPEQAPKKTESFANALNPYVPQQTSERRQESRRALGHLWISLGRVVLAAADMDMDTSSAVLSRVAFVLSRLQHKGFLPSDIMSDASNEDPTTLQHGSLISEMSNSLLLDPFAKGEEDSSTSAAIGEHDIVSEQSFQQVKSNVEGRSPEQWLEYVLWCCVHGGWLMEGASIVEEMRRLSGDRRWSLMYWSRLSAPNAPSGRSSHATALERSTVKHHSTSSVVKQTISTEVVVALADGLASSLRGVRKSSGHSPNEIIDKLFTLRRVLDRDDMSLGTSTWDAVIARLMNAPGMQAVDNNPRLFENLLELAKPYGAEPSSRNAPTNGESEDVDHLPMYVFEGSAAVIGLYHRALLSNIRARDISGALRVLSALQRLTDKNKQRSLQEFFSELEATSVQEARVQNASEGDEANGGFPGVHYPGFFPSLPMAVLAELLDLLNECNAQELGGWMIYSSDVDGPLIPESEHGNQVLAPALIRFAAATSDTNLLGMVTRAQTSSVSGNTLVALCESRIRQANFEGAVQVFGLIRQYALHEWTASDLGAVLKALLLQLYGPRMSHDLDSEQSQHAATLLQRLLRGDMGQVWGTSFTQLDTIVALLSSLDGYLQELCSNLMPQSQQYRVELPTSCFNSILTSTVQVWGSSKGMQLWQTWCTNEGSRDRSAEDSSAMPRRRSVAEQFSGTESPSPTDKHLDTAQTSGTPDYAANPPPSIAIMAEGRIEPSLPGLRIIVQQALIEHREQLTHDTPAADDPQQREEVAASGVGHEVLDWAIPIFRELGLSGGDIDYELQGYLSTRQPDMAMAQSYSPETLRIWQAFTGPRRRWAQDRELAMRDFAGTKAEKQLVYEEEGAAERFLVLSLAKDYKLHCETEDAGDAKRLVLTKTKEVQVPSQILDEILDLAE